MIPMKTVVERFLRYVSFDTQSDENSTTCPSTAKQKNIFRLEKTFLIPGNNSWNAGISEKYCLVLELERNEIMGFLCIVRENKIIFL